MPESSRPARIPQQQGDKFPKPFSNSCNKTKKKLAPAGESPGRSTAREGLGGRGVQIQTPVGRRPNLGVTRSDRLVGVCTRHTLELRCAPTATVQALERAQAGRSAVQLCQQNANTSEKTGTLGIHLAFAQGL